MIFHEKRLLADDSHVISYLIFVKNWEKYRKICCLLQSASSINPKTKQFNINLQNIYLEVVETYSCISQCKGVLVDLCTLYSFVVTKQLQWKIAENIDITLQFLNNTLRYNTDLDRNSHFVAPKFHGKQVIICPAAIEIFDSLKLHSL